jgi:hypothetical protein
MCFLNAITIRTGLGRDRAIEIDVAHRHHLQAPAQKPVGGRLAREGVFTVTLDVD